MGSSDTEVASVDRKGRDLEGFRGVVSSRRDAPMMHERKMCVGSCSSSSWECVGVSAYAPDEYRFTIRHRRGAGDFSQSVATHAGLSTKLY